MDWISPESWWRQTSDHSPEYPGLNDNICADVVIIGGGITGLTAALQLKAANRKVVILEAGRVGAGTTSGTSGHLDAVPEQNIQRLIRDHSLDNARIITEARAHAIDQIERWSRESDIDCQFARVPAFRYSEEAEGAEEIRLQLDDANRIGLNAHAVERVDLPFNNAGGLRFDNQARFHSLRYLNALAKRFHGDGCTIYEHSRAQPPSDDMPCVVKTDRGSVSAGRVLLCAHSCFLGISEIDLRIAPYQSYVLAAELEDEFPDGLFWDDADPYHYWRRASDQHPSCVIVGGCDHKTGQGDDESESMRRLEHYVRRRVNVREIKQRWSAEFFQPADGLPLVGRVPFAERIYIATGFSGSGLTFGTVAGLTLADILLDRPSPVIEVLSPSRLKPLASAGNLLSENLNAAKHFLADRLHPQPIRELHEIPPGTGKLVRYRGRSIAAFRNTSGVTFLLSPTCTHAGCFVQWNEQEHTWDCPCHGGRFSPVGKRLYGPPAKDLEQIPEQEL